ncbi:MAG: transglutaminase domain-containing protein [Candidatus Spyradocola sp.]
MLRKLFCACVAMLIVLAISACSILPFGTQSDDRISLLKKKNSTMNGGIPTPMQTRIAVELPTLRPLPTLTPTPSPTPTATPQPTPEPTATLEITPAPETVLYISDARIAEITDNGKRFLLSQHTDKRFLTVFDAVYRGVLAHEEHIELPMEITNEEAGAINRLLQLDFPELFYFTFLERYFYRGSDRDRIYSMDVGYCMDQAEAEAAQAELDAAVRPILLEAEGLSNYEKEKFVHDHVIQNCKYDLDAPYPRNIYGALVNGRAVCAGYAHAMTYLLRKLDIPCAYLSGLSIDEEGNTESHGWNLVCISGVWTLLDATWDDPTGGEDMLNHTYFNLNSALMGKSHQLSEFYDAYTLPECDSLAVSYSAYEGVLIPENGSGEVVYRLTDELRRGKTEVCVQFVSERDYEEVYTNYQDIFNQAAIDADSNISSYSVSYDEKGQWLKFHNFKYN